MTLQELYEQIGGDYDQAIRVLRLDKLIDKHIRKLSKNGVIDEMIAAGEDLDPTRLFESAHATKGICANLGLTGLADAASVIAEEFRPGNDRTFTDEQVAEKIQEIADMYARTIEGIRQYEEA